MPNRTKKLWDNLRLLMPYVKKESSFETIVYA